jgi:hypothetical protein
MRRCRLHSIDLNSEANAEEQLEQGRELVKDQNLKHYTRGSVHRCLRLSSRLGHIHQEDAEENEATNNIEYDYALMRKDRARTGRGGRGRAGSNGQKGTLIPTWVAPSRSLTSGSNGMFSGRPLGRVSSQMNPTAAPSRAVWPPTSQLRALLS